MSRNGHNNYDSTEWDKFVTLPWQHVQSAWTTVKKKNLMYIRQLLRGFVVHGRDHAINEIFICCPFMYWCPFMYGKVVRATFGDQQVYKATTMSPMQSEQFLLQQSKQGWLKRYSWSCSSLKSSLPIAYILLKQKKNFQVARPIINCKFFIFFSRNSHRIGRDLPRNIAVQLWITNLPSNDEPDRPLL